MQASFKRYLLVFGASMLGVFLAVWAYVASMPMAYMESGYAAWAAKAAMLRECRLGQIAFFGDSRLEAGVVPALLPVQASNFGLAAGTAVEVESAVRRAVDCSKLPRQAVIALIPEHFGPMSRFFWLLSLRYGFVQPAELYDAERLAQQVGDTRTLATPTPDGLGGPVRDWLYAARFPSLSFSSLVQGRVFGRFRANLQRFDAVLRDRGWSEYASGGDRAAEGDSGFAPTGVQRIAFEHAVEALRRRGVEVLLLVMPVAQSDRRDARSDAEYLDYLASVARRFPGVRLVGSGIPVWPDRMFADGAHLAGSGARAFSQRLAACIEDGRLQPGCDLRWNEGAVGQAAALPVLHVN